MVVVSLDMFLNNTQDIFVKYRNDKFCLVKGNYNSGKTISMIFKALYLKRNYCFDKEDKILVLVSEKEIKNIIDIYNYVNRSDLYKSIIPSDEIEVHVLTYREFTFLRKYNVKYTHLIIDNIEEMDCIEIEDIFSTFRNVSYSKVFFVQNFLGCTSNVTDILEYSRRIIGIKECTFKFRNVIESFDRDEFTQIRMMPSIKYKDYKYEEYVDLSTKTTNAYYIKDGKLYIDRGTFIQDMTFESMEIFLLDRTLKIKDSIKVINNWLVNNKNLFFLKIDDEGMGKYDLYREDIVLVDKESKIKNNDIVVILKDKYIYARIYVEDLKGIKFISSESIFKDIYMDNSVVVLGKVMGYIRKY